MLVGQHGSTALLPFARESISWRRSAPHAPFSRQINPLLVQPGREAWEVCMFFHPGRKHDKVGFGTELSDIGSVDLEDVHLP